MKDTIIRVDIKAIDYAAYNGDATVYYGYITASHCKEFLESCGYRFMTGINYTGGGYDYWYLINNRVVPSDTGTLFLYSDVVAHQLLTPGRDPEELNITTIA